MKKFEKRISTSSRRFGMSGNEFIARSVLFVVMRLMNLYILSVMIVGFLFDFFYFFESVFVIFFNLFCKSFVAVLRVTNRAGRVARDFIVICVVVGVFVVIFVVSIVVGFIYFLFVIVCVLLVVFCFYL